MAFTKPEKCLVQGEKRVLCSDGYLDLASLNLAFNFDQIHVISCEGNSPPMTLALAV